MQKRILTLALAVLMVLSLLPFGAAADDGETSGTWGPNGTWTIDAEGTLTIRGNEDADYQSMRFKSAPDEWKDNPAIKSIVVALGVTYLPFDDNFAIYGCSFSGDVNLKKVSISATVKNARAEWFNDCPALEEFYVHPLNEIFSSVDGVLFRGNFKLIRCPAQKTGVYVIPDGIDSVEDYAFEGCTKLTGVVIPKETKTISSLSFLNCPNMKSVELAENNPNLKMRDGLLCENKWVLFAPKGLSGAVTIPTSCIEEYAFENCTGITALYLHENIESIGEGAFRNCTGLTEITFPNDIKDVGVKLFEGCTNLNSVVLSEGVTKIPEEMFADCPGLKHVWLPDTLTEIGYMAFSNCTALDDVRLPDSATNLGGGVFSGCTALKNVYLPDGVTTIPYNFFSDCSSLKKVDLPSGITGIRSQAFSGCTSLTDIQLPDSVTEIGSYVFEGCAALKSISLPGSITEISRGLFQDCTSLQTVNIPNGITIIDTWAFENCTAMTEIRLPDSVNTVNQTAFDGCTSLRSFTFPEGVSTLTKSVQGSFFERCTTLETITFLGPIETIPASLFENIASLKTVHFPSTLKRINDSAFYGCTSLTEIRLPEGFQSFSGWGAFCGCSNLQSVTLPGSVTSFGVETFRDCNKIQSFHLSSESGNLTEVDGVIFSKDMKTIQLFPTGRTGSYVVPEGVTTLSSASFGSCTGLTSITLPSTLIRIEAGAMSLTSVKEITVPHSVKSMSKDSFPDCLTDLYYEGTEEEWNQIVYDPANFLNVRVHFISVPTPPPTTQPTTQPTPPPTTQPTPPPTTPPVTSFTDVPADAYYAEPVSWAVNHEPQITNGVGNGLFAPLATCTRDQIVTFLWRAMGCPEPTSTVNPFVDVKPSDYFYKPVLWAVEKGITNGMDLTHFGPTVPCTRAHVVTFLWRAHEKPAAGTNNPFVDVPSGQYYTDAVLWAVSKNITNGMDATHFGPDEPCQRGQIVTFLYRDMAK